MPTIVEDKYDAWLFDLDGVITDTAVWHCVTWKQVFDEFLAHLSERTGTTFEPFRVETDYVELMNGKPRYEGSDTFLRSRGIELEWGSPDDPADWDTVCGLGNRKNLFYGEMLRTGVPQVFETSVDLIRRLSDAGKGVAIVSSSTNANTILAAVGIQVHQRRRKRRACCMRGKRRLNGGNAIREGEQGADVAAIEQQGPRGFRRGGAH